MDCNIYSIAIIAAMEQEIALLREMLNNATKTEICGIIIYQGIIENESVLLMQCGIGKVNAALGTTLLLNNFKVKAVINTGSAGALAIHLEVGDVVIANELLHHDVDVTAFGYELGQIPQMPVCYPCNDKLIKVVHEAVKNISNSSIYSGLIVSGDQFIHGGDALNKIRQLFPKALAVEMEAATIAQICYHFSVPFIVIRAISDNANGDAAVDFDAFLSQASRNSTNIVRQFLNFL